MARTIHAYSTLGTPPGWDQIWGCVGITGITGLGTQLDAEMLLARGASRLKSLGRVREPLFAGGNFNEGIVAWATVLHRKAGGVAGKRRSKYKGQYKASSESVA